MSAAACADAALGLELRHLPSRPAAPGARFAQAREILAGMVRGSRQRRRRDHQEALGIGDGLVSLEFIRRDEATTG